LELSGGALWRIGACADSVHHPKNSCAKSAPAQGTTGAVLNFISARKLVGANLMQSARLAR
jgi:hypothetical protein